jgi:hypothetical protein
MFGLVNCQSEDRPRIDAKRNREHRRSGAACPDIAARTSLPEFLAFIGVIRGQTRLETLRVAADHSWP